MNAHIHFVITGGTFDGALKETGALPSSTAIENYLKDSIKPYFGYSLEIPFLKDSRDITPAERAELVRTIAHSEYSRIVVTHGTYTLVETAEAIVRGGAGVSKTVILVGAMIPFSEPGSDAPFNLGFACAAALSAPPGISVAMHARLWLPSEVEKNLGTNRFEDRSIRD